MPSGGGGPRLKLDDYGGDIVGADAHAHALVKGPAHQRARRVLVPRPGARHDGRARVSVPDVADAVRGEDEPRVVGCEHHLPEPRLSAQPERLQVLAPERARVPGKIAA